MTTTLIVVVALVLVQVTMLPKHVVKIVSEYLWSTRVEVSTGRFVELSIKLTNSDVDAAQ